MWAGLRTVMGAGRRYCDGRSALRRAAAAARRTDRAEGGAGAGDELRAGEGGGGREAGHDLRVLGARRTSLDLEQWRGALTHDASGLRLSHRPHSASPRTNRAREMGYCHATWWVFLLAVGWSGARASAAADTVVVCTVDGQVHALDADTGDARWSVVLGDPLLSSWSLAAHTGECKPQPKLQLRTLVCQPAPASCWVDRKHRPAVRWDVTRLYRPPCLSRSRVEAEKSQGAGS